MIKALYLALISYFNIHKDYLCESNLHYHWLSTTLSSANFTQIWRTFEAKKRTQKNYRILDSSSWILGRCSNCFSWLDFIYITSHVFWKKGVETWGALAKVRTKAWASRIPISGLCKGRASIWSVSAKREENQAQKVRLPGRGGGRPLRGRR